MKKNKIVDISNYDLVIISDKGATAIFKKGVQEDGVQFVEFKHSADELPQLKIEQHLLKGKSNCERFKEIFEENKNDKDND